ncbi:MAG: hypothetical protein GY871_15135, partial [Actinomycetales bacterium]|nr:hypothetical protein [Actinomycetales bacterium]
NRTTFDGEVRLNGPVTDPSHAVNKAYVDGLGDTLETKEAARVAALTNIDLVAPAPEIDGVTLAEGDRVLLAGQTNSAENGVYLSGADGTLTRAGDFNAIEKIGGGSHLFIQEGSQAGQGYVLADLGEAFELGTSALVFSRFTVDPTQSLDLGNDLAVAGNADVDGSLNAGRLEVNGPFAPTRLDGEFNILGGFDTRFEGERVTFRNFETRFDNPETLFDGGNVEFRNNRTTFDGEVRLNGPVTSDGQVNISGALNAGRLEIDGAFGGTRLDGVINRLSGDINEINAFETMFEGDSVRFRNFDTRFDSEFNVFRGNETRFENNRTTFDGEVRLNGPVTDPSHAVNKAYVDGLGDTLETKEAARVAALTN